jgi:hypothetical protein
MVHEVVGFIDCIGDMFDVIINMKEVSSSRMLSIVCSSNRLNMIRRMNQMVVHRARVMAVLIDVIFFVWFQESVVMDA